MFRSMSPAKMRFEARQKGWEEAQRLAGLRCGAKRMAAPVRHCRIRRSTASCRPSLSRKNRSARAVMSPSLGVLFDRAGRAIAWRQRRPAPLGTAFAVAVTHNAGAPTLFEQRTSWQRSWAKYRTADSTIDYVRPSGAGGESLLLNAGRSTGAAASGGAPSRPVRRCRCHHSDCADRAAMARRAGGRTLFGALWPGQQFLGAFTLRTTSPAQASPR